MKKKYAKVVSPDEKLLPDVLLEYLKRVDATVTSFRKAVVRDFVPGSKYGSYDRTSITIMNDGTIKTQKNIAPTEDEQTAIKEAYKGLKLPETIGASKAEATAHIKEIGKDPDDFFWMWDRKDNTVRMLHERIEEGEGKGYVPHSFWNDGEWRKLEPDGLLSFWKPEKRKIDIGKPWIMIHEGAKSAHAATFKINYETHPWGEELAKYEHWGMIGGSTAPWRSDWNEVHREKPGNVVYVCDNDIDGKSALQNVSRSFNASLVGIFFDNSFPQSWDMADPIPEDLFSKEEGRYSGPRLVDLMKPATWATKRIYTGEKGRPSFDLTRDFKKEWVHSVSPDAYVNVNWPSTILDMKEFNDRMSPFSDVKDTATLVYSEESMKTARLNYHPGKKSGSYAGSAKKGIFINTYEPGDIEPEKGDVGPWLEFMEQMFPIEGDRNEMLRWCATLIARPDIKMNYGVLLVSETQGVGKSTLGSDVLCRIMGKGNYYEPSETLLVDNQFNDWMSCKRLLVIHEIYSGNSSKAYNKLKSIFSEDTLSVRAMYKGAYECDNWVHILACSNSMRAIKIDNNDRRWFIPKVTEKKMPKKYWDAWFDWIKERGGLNKIVWWAGEYVKKHGPVVKGNRAPESEAKRAMIEEALSPGQKEASNLLTYISEKKEKAAWMNTHTKPVGANGSWKPEGVIVLDEDVVEHIKDTLYDGRRPDFLEKPSTIRRLAKERGYYVHEQKVRKGKRLGFLICSEEWMLEAQAHELMKRIKPLDVKAVAKELDAI